MSVSKEPCVRRVFNSLLTFGRRRPPRARVRLLRMEINEICLPLRGRLRGLNNRPLAKGGTRPRRAALFVFQRVFDLRRSIYGGEEVLLVSLPSRPIRGALPSRRRAPARARVSQFPLSSRQLSMSDMSALNACYGVCVTRERTF